MALCFDFEAPTIFDCFVDFGPIAILILHEERDDSGCYVCLVRCGLFVAPYCYVLLRLRTLFVGAAEYGNGHVTNVK